MAKSATKTQWKSRAVTRLIEAGSMTECTHCGERVKFKARERHMQVICNVYVKGTWDRVEHFHAPCYDEADQPFGEPQD
jgi:DNA-directed RNA polymerase subunit RPC12/RpoP